MGRGRILARGDHELCSRRGWEFILVPCADELSLLGRSRPAPIPGPGLPDLQAWGPHYVDPLESFTDALLRLKNDGTRQKIPTVDPLYNLHLMGDQHFSPLGTDLWARVLARRLLLVWDRQVLNGMPGPEPMVATPAPPIHRSPATSRRKVIEWDWPNMIGSLM